MKRSMIVLVFLLAGMAHAQEPTATPAQIRLSTSTPVPIDDGGVPEGNLNVGEITPSATAIDTIFAQPISGEINVRTSPEISEDNLIGSLRSGERYVVLGRYVNWVQIQFDLAPTQRAWVYRDLIEIVGNEALIPVIDLNPPTEESADTINATQTLDAILALPGGVLTVTADARVIQLPQQDGEGRLNRPLGASGATPLPTYTFPPGVASVAPTNVIDGSNSNSITASSGAGNAQQRDIAPIVPIVLLGAFGSIGLLISAIRR